VGSDWRAAKKTLLVIVASFACAAPPPPQPTVVSRAIPIGEGGTPPIFFEKTILRLPAGAEYGAVHDLSKPHKSPRKLVHTTKHVETEEFNILITDRLLGLGYDAVDPTDAVFTPQNTVMTRFRIVGVVTELDIQTYKHWRNPDRGYQTVELDLEVRLYDAEVKDVVYTRSFHGSARDEGNSPAALPKAALFAIEGALSDERFVHLVTEKRGIGTAREDTIRLPACPVSGIELPEDTGEVSKAVVTVRQGGSTGAGILVSPQGHVLTAAHLVARDRTPRVEILGVVELDAEIVRIDPIVDIAVLKIPGSGHHCAPLSDRPADVGMELFAIGVPIDDRLAGTVTRGIVSGHPEIQGRTLLQTDASLNPGSSGGPVLDGTGHVIGVVSSKFFGVGIEGVGFAVPVDVIRAELRLEHE